MELRLLPEPVSIMGTECKPLDTIFEQLRKSDLGGLYRGPEADRRYQQHKENASDYEKSLFVKLFGDGNFSVPLSLYQKILVVHGSRILVTVQQVFADCPILWRQLLKTDFVETPNSTENEAFDLAVVLNACNYPYSLPLDAFHALIWCPHTNVLDMKLIGAVLSEVLLAEYGFFINPQNRRSILSIDHGHIFIRIPPPKVE